MQDALNPLVLIGIIAAYFFILVGISWWKGKNADEESYFLGNRSSPWYLVAFGMIGDSLSGVTYISVPGAVANSQFSYLQLVLGYFVGYFIISKVLLPIYYKMNLVSIYSYLEERFGKISQKTGSFYFLLSRTLGAAGRVFLAAGVIQLFVFDQIESVKIPFWLSVSVIIALMLLYTYRGGIKTLVWTDTFQSIFLILGVILSIAAIVSQSSESFSTIIEDLCTSKDTKIFFWDWQKTSFFPKQFIGGIFIAVAMTGLDQNMMQKNLSLKTLGEAQKNIFWFSIVLVIVNVFFLALGTLLYKFAATNSIDLPINAAGKVATDMVFPTLALKNLGVFAGLVFILGLTAATFSSADSVLTTLTTSTYVDMLELDKNEKLSAAKKVKYRTMIHIGFAIILWLVILLFRALNSKAIIDTILMVAGYTYGPLLGLFAFGLFTKHQLKDKMVPLVCVIAPLLTYFIAMNSKNFFNGYEIGNELILLNGTLIFCGLMLLKKKV